MDILYIGLITILASAIGTLTGFGTSTIMVPILILFLPLQTTLLLVGIIHWFSDIWKAFLFKRGINWKLILAFGIPGMVASYLGASLVFAVPQNLLIKILGVFLTMYSFFLFFNPRFKLPQNMYIASIGGGLSGFLAGLIGVGGAIKISFLSMFDLKKAVFISTAGFIAFFVDLTRIATYLVDGAILSRDLMFGLALFIPASFLGAKIAQKITDKIPQDRFRTVVVAFLLLVGMRFILFS